MSDVPDPFYPAWRFHPVLPAKIVTAAEDALLDKEWVHTPSELPMYGPEPEPTPAPEPAPLPTEPPPPAALTPDPAPAPKKSHHKKKEPVA